MLEIRTDTYRGYIIESGVRNGQEWAVAKTRNDEFVKSVSGADALRTLQRWLDGELEGELQ
jgi:hypothetical protein